MNIYVGNLNYKTTDAQLRELFEQYGTVEQIKLVKDRDTGKRKGFGFVIMDDEGAKKAIDELNEKEFDGRLIKVNEAHTK